jgi:alkylation response protein AidB-like acyl-CoA dehydrogenase
VGRLGERQYHRAKREEVQTMTATATSLEAVRALFPLIGKHAHVIEQERCLPEPVVRALTEAGVFRLLVPQALGGAEADPVTVCQIVEELSKADGSTGWCAMIGASYGLFGGLLPEEAAREIYTDPGSIVAGALRPNGIAHAVAGGYHVSGCWPFGSGITHSTWGLGACRVFDGETLRLTPSGAPELRLLFFPAAELEIIDTWHVVGLRGTGSHDYEVKALFVPAHRACWFSQPPVQPGPLYTLPVIALFAPLIACVSLGIARHALDELQALASVKKPVRAETVLRDTPQIQAQIGEAEGLLRAGRAFLYEAVAAAWDTARRGQRLSWEQRGLLWLAATQAVTQALQAVDLMFRAGGSSSIYVTLTLERCLRDIRVAAQHHCVTPSNYELAGQLFLGVDPAGTFWGRDYRGDA